MSEISSFHIQISVSLLEAAALGHGGVVRWGTRPETDEPGVYLVTLTDDADAVEPTLGFR